MVCGPTVRETYDLSHRRPGRRRSSPDVSPDWRRCRHDAPRSARRRASAGVLSLRSLAPAISLVPAATGPAGAPPDSPPVIRQWRKAVAPAGDLGWRAGSKLGGWEGHTPEIQYTK